MREFKVILQTPHHCAHIQTHDQIIQVFKYNQHYCDFEVFTSESEASEYIMEPLPAIYYSVNVTED